MIRAYATSRGHKRGGASAVHAVDEMSHLCGALDAMCGRVIVTALIGEWDPGDRHACRHCIAALASLEVTQ